MSDKNTGQLADETLRDLTVLEETLNQIMRGNSVPTRDLLHAEEHLENAQENASEILNRYEQREGPISTDY